MYWLTHTTNEDGYLQLKIVESKSRPIGTNVINHHFNRPEEALALMSHYLLVGDDGFVKINQHLTDNPITMIERTLMAYTIDPALLRLRVVSLTISSVTFVILLLHLLRVI